MENLQRSAFSLGKLLDEPVELDGNPGRGNKFGSD